MKPTLETPSTLMLALWVAEGKAACTALLRTDSNEVTALPGCFYGEPWEVLADALEKTQDMAAHCLVVTNWEPAIRMLGPLHLDEQSGHDHWRAVAAMSLLYGGYCGAVRSESMPRTEALWKQHSTMA